MNSTREYILNSISRNMPATKTEYPVIPDFPKNSKDILEEFKENLLLGAGAYYDVKDKEEALKLIKELYPEAKIICSASPDIKGNKDLRKINDPHDLADVDVGIIRAQFGVAETGMVWLTENELILNALGFLSQHLIILLKKDQLVKDMYEAYKKVDIASSHYGCFMLGPSATADIGAVMVRGAQGARTLTVFFM
ncbi:MAG: LUD domain-containing protein [Bacteroidales bacterium]|nr:LUD domain-containing protein [Bacteroidales bacterium]